MILLQILFGLVLDFTRIFYKIVIYKYWTYQRRIQYYQANINLNVKTLVDFRNTRGNTTQMY